MVNEPDSQKTEKSSTYVESLHSSSSSLGLRWWRQGSIFSPPLFFCFPFMRIVSLLIILAGQVELSAAELESLRSELSELAEREAYLKAQYSHILSRTVPLILISNLISCLLSLRRLEHVDEVLRSARLSGYLFIPSVWTLSILWSMRLKVVFVLLLTILPQRWAALPGEPLPSRWLASSVCCPSRTLSFLLFFIDG